MALAGPAGPCWLSQECSAPSLLQTLPQLPDLRRKKNAWPCRACPHRLPRGRLARRELHKRSTCCCSGTPPLLVFITLHSRACACLYIRGLRMCSNSTTPSHLAVSGLLAGGWRGKRDRPPWQLPALAAAQVEACLEEHAAAAGSDGSCRRSESQECSAPSLSRVVCCRLCLTFAEKTRHGKKWDLAPTAFLLAGWPGGSGTEGAPTASADQCRRWTGLLLDKCTCLDVSVILWSQNLRRLPPSSKFLAGWPGGCGERGTYAVVSIVLTWQLLRWRLAWKYILMRMAQECPVPSPSRVLCC